LLLRNKFNLRHIISLLQILILLFLNKIIKVIKIKQSYHLIFKFNISFFILQKFLKFLTKIIICYDNIILQRKLIIIINNKYEIKNSENTLKFKKYKKNEKYVSNYIHSSLYSENHSLIHIFFLFFFFLFHKYFLNIFKIIQFLYVFPINFFFF